MLKRRVLIPGGIASAVVVALLLSWTLGAFDQSSPATGTQLVLTRASYTAIGEGTLRGSLAPGTPASPVMAVIGNDFAYGLMNNAQSAFPEVLGSYTGYRVVVSADIGAGYLNHGEGDNGPYSVLLANMDLARLRPSIVLVQGGYNDAGSDPFAVSAAVVSLIATIRQEAPYATLVVMGSFDANVVGSPTPPVSAVNSTILDAAQSVDPKPVIIDPLTADWEFQRAADNLHPTAAGNRSIASYAALAMQAAGVVPRSKVHIPASALTVPGEGPPAPAGPAIPAGNQPVLLVIGASFAAGVGVNLNPQAAWPAIVGQRIGYRVVVSADPGAGFVALGDGAQGPFSQLLAAVNITTLNPSIILIQGGHNDQDVPPDVENQAVLYLFRTIAQEAPQARVGLVGYFDTTHPGPVPTSVTSTNQTIITAARSVVPNLLVFDPLSAHWVFPRIFDHLHPTAAGHKRIAGYVAGGLIQSGVVHQIQ
jgi:acyl-CoA thioesterase-1